MSMKNETGINKAGIPTKKKPHLGDILLKKYRDRITEGFEDLKRFELIDRLEKPVLNFIFYGNKKKILYGTATPDSDVDYKGIFLPTK